MTMEMKNKGSKKGGNLEMVKDPATGKMVPAYAMDGEGSDDMAKGKKGMKPEMKPKKKKKRSDAMDAVMGTGPAAPRKPMKKGGMAKKGYARGGMMKKGYAKGGAARIF